jgi:hypothetical protein
MIIKINNSAIDLANRYGEAGEVSRKMYKAGRKDMVIGVSQLDCVVMRFFY